MSTYVGTLFNDSYFGAAQTEYGLNGNDVLAPSVDNKPYLLYGGNGADDLYGFSYDDQIYGGQGPDDIFGFYGNDRLSGGTDSDVFVFNTTLNKKKNVDTIVDFEPGLDFIDLDKSIFTKAGPVDQTLKAKKFEIGKEASNKKVRVTYNDKNGVVKYDPDGSGSKKSTKFAVLDANLKMDNDDFFVI